MKLMPIFILALMLGGCAGQHQIDPEVIDRVIDLIEDRIEEKDKPDPTPEPPSEPPVIEPEKPVTEPNIVPDGAIKLHYHKRTNGDRWTYYTGKYKPRLKIRDRVTVVVGDHKASYVARTRSNGSIGADGKNGFVLKNSEMPSRGIAVLLPAGYKGPYKPAYLWISK